MLIGQYTSKLTDKERLSVPSKFREEIGTELIIAKWYENCLLLTRKSDWSNLISRLMGDARLITSPVRDIDRFILGSAFEISLDQQGRFVLPTILKEFAKIVDEVVFVGLVDRVEIWPIGSWQKLEEKAEEMASHAIEKIAKNKLILQQRKR